MERRNRNELDSNSEGNGGATFRRNVRRRLNRPENNVVEVPPPSPTSEFNSGDDADYETESDTDSHEMTLRIRLPPTEMARFLIYDNTPRLREIQRNIIDLILQQLHRDHQRNNPPEPRVEPRGLTEEVILGALESFPYQDSNSDVVKDQCPICLSDYVEGDSVVKLQCGHLYHSEGIKEWLKENNACPICRAEAVLV